MIISTTQFINKYELSKGMYDTAKIEAYIDKYEKRYLIELLGPELYDEFMSDLDVSNVPQSPNFEYIFNPFHTTISPSTVLISEGIVEMLLGFIYFEYAKDLINQMTPFGNVKPMSENSNVVSGNSTMIYNRYNEAIKTYRAIQMYIMFNQNMPIGEVISWEVFDSGTGWSIGYITDIPTTGGSGTGAAFNVKVNSLSPTDFDITIADAGLNYQLNDFLTLQAVNDDTILQLTYVSKGDYTLFNGVNKQFNYWL